MDEAHLDLGVHVGVTLRSLLENRELLNPPGNCSVERIQDNIDLRIRCADRINDGYIRAVKRNEKDEKEGENESFDGSSAFLGPMLWDKTLTDFKLEYVDLDEFLCENGMSCEANQKDHSHMVRQHQHHHHQQQQQQQQQHQQTDTSQSRHHHLPSSVQYNRNSVPVQEDHMCRNIPKACETDKMQQKADVPIECKFTQDDLALATVPGHNNFDPTVQSFSEDELKPQPMVKKSKKHFVPDSMKDEKYWMRRQKNNIAAKRSREARRVKENQIVLRASYLEKENHVLREEMEKLRGENKMLRHRLKKYEQ